MTSQHCGSNHCPGSLCRTTFTLSFLFLLPLHITHTHTHTDVTSMKLQSKLPLILVALSRFPRPQSVVEVAWQPFSPSPQFGVDGDTSAWGSHALSPGSCNYTDAHTGIARTSLTHVSWTLHRLIKANADLWSAHVWAADLPHSTGTYSVNTLKLRKPCVQAEKSK